MSIKRILQDLVISVKDKEYLKDGYGKNFISYAEKAILAEFSKMLPEERMQDFHTNNYTEVFNKNLGYNQCLTDIKSKLAEEKGENK